MRREAVQQHTRVLLGALEWYEITRQKTDNAVRCVHLLIGKQDERSHRRLHLGIVGEGGAWSSQQVAQHHWG
jgi:hypothetical protein